MWMLHCSGGAVGVPVYIYYRDVDGDIAPIYMWCMSVDLSRPSEVYIYILYGWGDDDDVALA